MITLNQTDLEAHGELYRLHSNLRYSCNPRVTFREGRGMRRSRGERSIRGRCGLPLLRTTVGHFYTKMYRPRRRTRFNGHERDERST